MAARDFREYCVVIPFEPMGRENRARPPRHVTVCPAFRSGATDIDVSAATLRRAVATLSPLIAVVSADARVGRDRNLPVQVVDSDDPHRLHLSIVAVFAGVARFEALVQDHHGDGYRPQVTATRESRFDPGDRSRAFECSRWEK